MHTLKALLTSLATQISISAVGGIKCRRHFNVIVSVIVVKQQIWFGRFRI